MAPSSMRSKYSHHRQATATKPPTAAASARTVQSTSAAPWATEITDSPSTIRVNNPNRSTRWLAWMGALAIWWRPTQGADSSIVRATPHSTYRAGSGTNTETSQSDAPMENAVR
jgi:hypothetical protein